MNAAESPRPWGPERTASLDLVLETTDLAVWTWDIREDRLSLTAPSAWAGQVAGGDDLPLSAWIDLRIHPGDREPVHRAVAALRAGTAMDVGFRLADTGGTPRWLLARGATTAEGGTPIRASGVLVDVTQHAKACLEHTRLLREERRARRRAAALQRVATAVSDAVTAEQVAAVTVEESLRSLGADAARVELWGTDRGGGTLRSTGVVRRTAGPAHLLEGPTGPPDPSSGLTRRTLPLGGRGPRRGEWTLAWADPPGWPDPDDAEVLRTLATECTRAVERAELYDQQRAIATVLQSALLPPVPRSVRGAGIAARHQPGEQGLDVGGDWYDIIDLSESRTGLVIGDVEGHNAASAAVMGQVRNALRAYSVEGSPPALVMGRVNRLLARSKINQLISCCYLEFDPSEGTATVVLAGHPPPLLIGPGGGAEFVPARPNLMLGVDDTTHFVEITVLLDPESCLLLYTDGLIETVDRSLPDGLTALRRWAGGRDADESLDEFVERLIRLARDGQQIVDDIALLALQYHPTGHLRTSRLRSVRRSFPLDATSASAARGFVNDILDQWRLGDVAPPVTLMTSELVANSVQHTTGRLEVALQVDDDRLRVEVVDRCEQLPTVRAPEPDGLTGRGLFIIEVLAHRWGADSRPTGKAVWFEVLLEGARGRPGEHE